MPDFKCLEPGDKIRLISILVSDFAIREREIKAGLPDAGWTVNCMERMIAQRAVLTITHIDEYGEPWAKCIIMGASEPEEHSLRIADNETWEYMEE